MKTKIIIAFLITLPISYAHANPLLDPLKEIRKAFAKLVQRATDSELDTLGRLPPSKLSRIAANEAVDEFGHPSQFDKKFNDEVKKIRAQNKIDEAKKKQNTIIGGLNAEFIEKSPRQLIEARRGFENKLVSDADLERLISKFRRGQQRIVELFINQGRFSEVQMILDLRKDDEYREFTRQTNADGQNPVAGGLALADPVVEPEQDLTPEEMQGRPETSHNPVVAQAAPIANLSEFERYREIDNRLRQLVIKHRELESNANRLDRKNEEASLEQQQLRSDIKQVQKDFESFLSELREDFAQKGQARKVEIDEISARAMRESQGLLKGLGDNVGLLQYYVTDKRVVLLMTTAGIQLGRSSDIDLKDLNRKIGELRRLLQNPKSNPIPVAQELYRVLVEPVVKDLDEAKIKTVMLSLDGALRYLPFGALHDGKQYLIQRWNLPMYTSVTRNKLRDAVSQQWQAAGLGVTHGWPDFKPLSGVRSEMGAIVKATAGGLMPGEVYLDDAFTAARLKDVGGRKFHLMHVASHFRFSPGTEINSFLLLGGGERLTLGDIRTQNYRFDNVDLLTLSACDTGLGGGRDEQGKEIEGFGVIAQQQGAKAVLATLWAVADQSTAILMADMYRRRQAESLSKIEALRKAQTALQTRGKYSHPYYWAPFILMGNWK